MRIFNHNTFRKLSWIFKKDLLKLLNQESGKTLDIGGDNFMKNYINNSSIEYYSLNNSYGNDDDERYKCDIIANAMNMPQVKDSSYDNVWCFQVLEHINKPVDLLNESFRILKPGGKIVFSIPQSSLLHESPNNFFYYTKYGINDLFENCGFIEIQIKPKGGFWLNSANRYFDYIMIWIESMRISDLGFGYSIFTGKNLLHQFISLLTIVPAIILFGLNLLLSCLISSADLHEDASIHYVFAKKPKI